MNYTIAQEILDYAKKLDEYICSIPLERKRSLVAENTSESLKLILIKESGIPIPLALQKAMEDPEYIKKQKCKRLEPFNQFCKKYKFESVGIMEYSLFTRFFQENYPRHRLPVFIEFKLCMNEIVKCQV